MPLTGAIKKDITNKIKSRQKSRESLGSQLFQSSVIRSRCHFTRESSSGVYFPASGAIITAVCAVLGVNYAKKNVPSRKIMLPFFWELSV